MADISLERRAEMRIVITESTSSLSIGPVFSCSVLIMSDAVDDAAPAKTLVIEVAMPAGLKDSCQFVCPLHLRSQPCRAHLASLTAGSWINWFAFLDDPYLYNTISNSQRTWIRQFGEIYHSVSLGQAQACPKAFIEVLRSASREDWKTVPQRRISLAISRGIWAVIDWAQLVCPSAIVTVSEDSDEDSDDLGLPPPLAATDDEFSDEDTPAAQASLAAALELMVIEDVD